MKKHIRTFIEAMIENDEEGAKDAFHLAVKGKVKQFVNDEEKSSDRVETLRVEERDALTAAIDSKITDFLQEEIVELRADIDRFRDLEAEYEVKLEEAKVEMGKQLKVDLSELVDKMDKFIEIRMFVEVEEMRQGQIK